MKIIRYIFIFLKIIFDFIKKIKDYFDRTNYRAAAIGGSRIDQIGYANYCLMKGYYIDAYTFAEIASYQKIPGALEIKEIAENNLNPEELDKALSLVKELYRGEK